MSKETDLEKIKELSKAFLNIEPEAVKDYSLFVMHPVFDFAFQAYENQPFNIFEDKETYKKLLQEITAKIEKCTCIKNLLLIFRENFRLTFFKYCKDYMSSVDYAETLRYVWVLAEFPMSDVNVKKRELLSYFKKANKEYLMNDAERKVLSELPDEVVVYRGTQKQKPGISWTLSKTKGKWFAHRFKTSGYLYTGKIKRENILCFIDELSEKEIILNDRLVYDLKIEEV